MTDSQATAAHAILDDWIAYARKIGANGVELHTGNCDGGAQNRFPQRLLATVKACNQVLILAKRSDGGDQGSEAEAVRSVRGSDGAGRDAVRQAGAGAKVRKAKGA